MSKERYHLKLHARATELLDLAIQAKNKKARAEHYVRLYDSETKKRFSFFVMTNNRSNLLSEVNRWDAVHARIIQAYADLMTRLNRPALERLLSSSEH